MTGFVRSLGKRKQKLPGYLLHSASGQARTIIAGKTFYLGEYGSEESRRRYGELIAQHAAGTRVDPFAKSAAAKTESGITISELTLVFMRHAETYYLKDGKRTAEYDCYKSAVGPMLKLYASTPVVEFGPLALKAVRQAMIDGPTPSPKMKRPARPWCRSFINKSVGRIRSVFRWAVANELIEPAVLQKLESVPPLLAGRTEATDHAPRRPVSDVHIEAVRKRVQEEVRDLIDLQLLTGARSGELLKLTSDMIDRTGDVWTAQLIDHKSAHRGKERVLVFGPKAKLILAKYIKLAPGLPLFTRRRDSYGRAVTIACDAAKITRWTPHWLRHNAASRLRAEYGLDVAQVMLGHSTADVTQVYAHLNLTKAIEVAGKVG